MIAINRRQILISGAFLWLFAVAGTTLVALTEYSASSAIAENERQLLLRNLHALLPPDQLDNDIAADTLELPAAKLLGTHSVSLAYRARRAGALPRPRTRRRAEADRAIGDRDLEEPEASGERLDGRRTQRDEQSPLRRDARSRR